MANDRTSGPAYKTWDETGLYTRPKRKKPKTIGRALGKPQKRKKLKPAKLQPPPREAAYGTFKYKWDLNTEAGMAAWVAHRKKMRKTHASDASRTDKHGKPSKARVSAKRVGGTKKKHPK
jgi:hypothetical protein